MNVTFKVYGLPTLNEHITENNRHRLKASAMKRKWTEAVAWAVTEAMYAKDPKWKRFTLDITYVQPNARHDKDNIAFQKKYILDGMQMAGLIANDGWNNVVGWTEHFEIDKTQDAHVVVTVHEVANG